jgi:hypothetical protein
MEPIAFPMPESFTLDLVTGRETIFDNKCSKRSTPPTGDRAHFVGNKSFGEHKKEPLVTHLLLQTKCHPTIVSHCLEILIP